MKLVWSLLLVALLFSAVCLPVAYVHVQMENQDSKQNFFFGVTYGLNSTSEAKLLIDKVKEYTNLFIVDSWDISTNETALNEICQYAMDSKMNVMVYFDFISYVGYPWLHAWLDNAKERWGTSFLGIYLYDEPGGKQIDTGQWRSGPSAKEAFENVTDYSDAANRFVTNIPSSLSTQNVKNSSLPIFTSDYALYWFDYEAGYDAIFAELGGTRGSSSKIQQISLCRGAANLQDKQWGTIITWDSDTPPYLENGTALLEDMLTAYRAGANYVIVFDYPRYPDTNPYGILTDEHFKAMKTFWDLIHHIPRSMLGQEEGQVAFVLPKDYGWGMRNLNDKIWGFWPADEKAPLIWTNMNKLITKYGLQLDIIYDDTRFNFEARYYRIYFWNSTID